MINLQPLNPVYYPAIHNIHENIDVWSEKKTIPEFLDFISKFFGWVVCDNSTVIGYVLLDSLVSKHQVSIHMSIVPSYHKKWLNESIYNQIFKTIFNDLGIKRINGLAIEGMANDKFQTKLGFKYEGTMRDAHKKGDQLYNIKLYSMLPEDMGWLH